MDNVNLWNSDLWNSNITKGYLYFSDISELFTYIKNNNKSLNFNINNKYNTSCEPTNHLERIASIKNINLTLTDSTHPILVDPSGYIPIYIDPIFYKDNLQELIKYTKEYMAYCIKNDKTIEIPDYVYEGNLIENIIKEYNIDISLDELLDRRYYYYEITTPLSDDDITKIKNNHLEFTVIKDGEYNRISTKRMISYYTMKDLKEEKCIFLSIPIALEEVNNFIYINENAIIKISPSSIDLYDELSYFNYISNLLKHLSNHDRTYDIQIIVNQRSVLDKSNLLKELPDNINLTFNNDLDIYDMDTYMEEEKKLNSLVEPIKNSELSPLEKYIAVYNIVKDFKPFKENEENPEEARYLKYILDNEYIVCVGYAKLLKVLLDKVGIDNLTMTVSVDTSYDKGFTQDETLINNNGHERNIIRIDDPKYKVHGIYIADATWDNSNGKNKDMYLNSLMTFDRKKEAFRLEKLNNYDLLFDFHNFEEFSRKLNYYINTNIEKTYGDGYIDKIIRTYKDLFRDIMNILNELDHEKYLYFVNKYYNNISDYGITLNNLEPLFFNFLTEYAEYIIPLSNNNVDLSTIISAAKVVKIEVDNLTLEEISKWLDSTTKDNLEVGKKSFPYRYDPSNGTEAFLEVSYIASSINKTK